MKTCSNGHGDAAILISLAHFNPSCLSFCFRLQDLPCFCCTSGQAADLGKAAKLGADYNHAAGQYYYLCVGLVELADIFKTQFDVVAQTEF